MRSLLNTIMIYFSAVVIFGSVLTVHLNNLNVYRVLPASRITTGKLITAWRIKIIDCQINQPYRT